VSTAARRQSVAPSSGRWLETAIVVVVLGAVALLSALVFVLAIGLLEPSAVFGDAALRDAVLGPITADAGSRALFAAGSLAIGLGALTLLLRRTSRRSRPESGAHVVSSGDAGLVVISNSGVASLIHHAVLRTRGVVEAEVQVKGRGAAPIGIRVDTVARAGTDLEQTGSAVRDAARSAAERLGGLEVGDVVVKLDVLSPEDMGLRTL
jgi:hypothetical protein